jgi:hypothetical protein
MPCLSNLLWLGHSNFTWQRVQVMKHLLLHFSPTSYHFIHLWSKLSPKHPVPKHPQSLYPSMSETTLYTLLWKLNTNSINPESSTNRAPEKREALFAEHLVPENVCGAW